MPGTDTLPPACLVARTPPITAELISEPKARRLCLEILLSFDKRELGSFKKISFCSLFVSLDLL
jgi:hypothetical protein